MDADERQIYHFLKSFGNEFIGAKEIARRAAGKKRFYEDPEWAKVLLMRMAERGIVEGDTTGRYRVKPVAKNKDKRWVSPEIAKILQENGVEVDNAGDSASDEYYEEL
jgi:hypothetical protein